MALARLERCGGLALGGGVVLGLAVFGEEGHEGRLLCITHGGGLVGRDVGMADEVARPVDDELVGRFDDLCFREV